MRPEPNKTRLRGKQSVAILLLVLSVVLPVWSLRDGATSQWHGQLRKLKTQRLLSARSLDILKDNQSVIDAVSERTHNVDFLKLALVESTGTQANRLGAEIVSLSITDSADTRALTGQDDNAISQLRVEFSARLSSAVDLLSLFDGVRESADWRPLEIRACSLVQVDKESSLLAECSIDITYHPELST